MRIYIESTIPSYVVACPARDLLQAARQQLTRDWWEFKRRDHELFTSQVVLDKSPPVNTKWRNRASNCWSTYPWWS